MSFVDDKIMKYTFFDKYKPEKEIAEGGYAKIYLASRLINPKKFALKLVYNIKI